MITAAAFLVQLVPVLGEISLFLLTPWWPVVFLNAAFVLIALDAVFGQKSWRLLVVPLLWFGGYAILSAVSHGQSDQLIRTAEAMNAQQLVPWNKATDSLRIINGPDDSRLASDLQPIWFIRAYDIDEVFDGRDSSTRLVRSDCPDKDDIDTINGVHYNRISRGGYLSKAPIEWAIDLCMVSAPRTPARNLTTVTGRPIDYRHGLVEGLVQDFDVTGSARASTVRRSVMVSPLPWLPIPVAGCHFKGGYGDQWDRGCHAYFGHFSWRSRTETTPLKTIAQTLGLKPATIEQRMPDLRWSETGM